MNVFERDLFTDPELIQDPAPYYAELRKRGPLVREPHHGVFMNACRNIAFGHGEHFCPGASLSRAEASISVRNVTHSYVATGVMKPNSRDAELKKMMVSAKATR